MFPKFFLHLHFIKIHNVLGSLKIFLFSKISLKSYPSLRIFQSHRSYISSQIFQNFLELIGSYPIISPKLLQKSPKSPRNFRKKFSVSSAKLLFLNVSRILSRFQQNYPPVSRKSTYKC